MKRIITAVIAILSLVVLVSAKRRAVAPPAPVDLKLDASRSFAITDKAILETFTFMRVLDAITANSGVTSEMLFRQWWSLHTEPHCKEILNGTARRCPTQEGALATAPFRPEDFIPIGIVNRFDQANATQCGQYRLIFANRNAAPKEAFHLIFEAELPNPRPEIGLQGCKPVAQFWADLSKIESGFERRTRLEKFFFEGIPGFAPAVHADHYRANQAGIRTLQLNQQNNFFPSFYQFRIARENGTLVMKHDVLENVSFSPLIDASNTDDRSKRFRQVYLENIKNLAVRDANLYFMKIPTEFQIQDSQPDKVYQFALNVAYFKSQATQEGKAFEAEINAELQRLGSTITPMELVTRAETQTCIGCHFTGTPVGEGVEFPAALDLMSHVSERGGTPTNFAISPAMKNVFIPHRMQILKDFLVSGKAPVHSN